MLEVLLSLIGLVALFAVLTWFFPSTACGPFLWVLAHLLYRLRVHHRDRVPATGGALVVANHVSYVDWLVLWVACPRPVTFVLWDVFFRNPILRFLLSWARHNTLRIDHREPPRTPSPNRSRRSPGARRRTSRGDLPGGTSDAQRPHAPVRPRHRDGVESRPPPTCR